jgi:hypothetical protein
MYTHRSGLGGGIGDIFGGIGEALGDWVKRQTGLPTSADERAMQTQQTLSVQREISLQQIQAQKAVQTAMITGAAVIGGLALYLALRRQ